MYEPCEVNSMLLNSCVMCVNRYKEYLIAKEQKIEMLKAIDDKLSECERFNNAHEVGNLQQHPYHC